MKAKGLCAALTVLLCLTAAVSIGSTNRTIVSAASVSWPEGPSVDSPSVVVMEAETGTILYEKDSQVSHYPASITKIMTTLLAIEYCDLDEVVTFSSDAVYNNEGDTSHIARDVGEEMTMEDCLYAVMLASANECAYAVAEHVGEKLGGDYQTFIDLMNEKAEELGCVNTHFNNCNGLPDDEHWTCAYDMALIAQAAYDNDIFRTITGTSKYTIGTTNKHSEETYLLNHHNMLYPYSSSDYLYDYCTGGKTGYTTEANYTLVTFAEKDGMALICVVMNTEWTSQYEDTTTLFNYYFSNFSVVNIAENEEELVGSGTVSAGLWNTNQSYAVLDEDAYILLPAGADISDVTYEASEEDLSRKGIASLTFSYDGHVVGSVELQASGAAVDSLFFGENALASTESNERVITIRPVHLAVAAGILVLLVALVFLCRAIARNIYVMRHNRVARRMEKQRFAKVKKKKYRKKDRLFH